MHEFNIKFLPQNKTIRVSRGMDILSAAVKAGIMLHTPCGGEGLCGKCRVIVKKGSAKSEPSKTISEADRKAGVVLACQTVVEGDLEVEIPAESLETHAVLSHEAEEFTKGVILEREAQMKLEPVVRKFYLELPKPSADDSTSDLERIYSCLGPKFDRLHISAKLATVKHLGEILRDSDFKITVTVGRKDGELEILAIEPGDATRANYGFAFDIGTTTVAGQLIDMRKNEILGSRIAFNKQARYGSDIITRIIYASEPQGAEKLQEAVLDNMDEIIEDLVRACEVSLSDVYSLTCAGNMTMMHLLLKVDPSSIRKAPYVPAATVFPAMNASEIGIEINPRGLVSFLPGVSSYVGGDIVAGVLACGLAEQDEIMLLADIGTNGEIVLGSRDWMMGAAASAGPAFEGSGLECGMKAVRGAIDKVTINERCDVKVTTIGAEKPKGICGSGYIDILCQMLKRGLIGKDGKLNNTAKCGRIRKVQHCDEFVVVGKDASATGKDIVITEDDIENLKRAKGAIHSAIVTLIAKVGKTLSDVRKIYIAGGFGNYLNIENAIFIGLLPDAARNVYEFIGNSSLAGARMCLLSHEAFERANDIHKNITYVDLGSEPGYMDEYVASLFFPHTDLGRFPSVRL